MLRNVTYSTYHRHHRRHHRHHRSCVNDEEIIESEESEQIQLMEGKIK